MTHPACVLWRHTALLYRVASHDIAARYAGSVLGAGWLVLQPVVVLGIYAAVYLYIFRVQVPGLSPVQYVFYVYAGLAPFLMTAEALSLAVTSLYAGRFVLTSGAFPLELLPPKAVLVSQGAMAVGFTVIAVGSAVTGTLVWTVVLFPALWGLYVLGLIGLAWVLSIVYLVFRDLPQLVAVGLMLVLVASPIAYTPEMVPKIMA